MQPKLSWFQRLRNGLARTSSQLTSQITALFTKRKFLMTRRCRISKIC
ncbi:hypothetical protein ACOJBO_23050 [Rhizobium beringeri]